MYFQKVSSYLRNLPLFESEYLFAGAENPQQVQRQLADWVRAGKVIQLRRGLYSLAQPVPCKNFISADLSREDEAETLNR